MPAQAGSQAKSARTCDTLISRKLVVATASLLLILDVAGTVASGEAPTAAPEVTLPAGYDWASRPHATHLSVDATPLSSVLDARTVRTPYLDLEITGLMPWRPYELRLGPIWRQVYSDGNGNGVAWNVIAESSTWTLRDSISGEPVTQIIIHGPPAVARPAWPGEGELDKRVRTAVPQGWETMTGQAIAQGLYSFTQGITIEGSVCVGRRTTIEALASGGIAASHATAGADFTTELKLCGENVAPPGRSMEMRQWVRVRKDVYEDNSYKIYAVGKIAGSTVEEKEMYFGLPRPEERYYWELIGLSTDARLRLTEMNAGGVRYGSGLKAFGDSLSVTFSAIQAENAENTLTFVGHPPGGDYWLWWVTGDRGADPRKGLVGAAWAVSDE